MSNARRSGTSSSSSSEDTELSCEGSSRRACLSSLTLHLNRFVVLTIITNFSNREVLGERD